MGHKTIAGRACADELLGGGTILVLTPGPDGVTLAEEQSFNPATGLYLARWCTREKVLDYLYPVVRTGYELTARPAEVDEEDESRF
jgi:hypothetical protein